MGCGHYSKALGEVKGEVVSSSAWGGGAHPPARRVHAQVDPGVTILARRIAAGVDIEATCGGGVAAPHAG